MRIKLLALAAFATITLAATAQSTPANHTFLRAQLDTTINSLYTRSGDKITAHLSEPTTLNGVALPKGTRLLGHVTNVQRAHANTDSQMDLLFDRVVLVSGQVLLAHLQLVGLAKTPTDRIPEIDGGDLVPTLSTNSSDGLFPAKLVPGDGTYNSGSVIGKVSRRSNTSDVRLGRGAKLLLQPAIAT
jgi:hypothetical protein